MANNDDEEGMTKTDATIMRLSALLDKCEQVIRDMLGIQRQLITDEGAVQRTRAYINSKIGALADQDTGAAQLARDVLTAVLDVLDGKE